MSKLSAEKHKILIKNEQTKSLSQWLNSLSITIIGSGVVSVSVGFVLFLIQQSFSNSAIRLDHVLTSEKTIFGGNMAILLLFSWGVLACFFRVCAHFVLCGIKEEV